MAVTEGLIGRPALPRLVDGPGCHLLAGDQRLDCGRVGRSLGAVCQSGQHSADRIERPRRHRLSQLFGDHRQIGNTIAGNVPTAQFFGDQQGGPPQFSGPPPPGLVEGDARRMQLPHPAQRHLFLEKCLGGGGEEYLFGGIDGSHDVGWDLPGRPSPVRMKAGRILIIRPIGFSGDSLVPPMVAMSNTVRDTGVQSIMTLTSSNRHA